MTAVKTALFRQRPWLPLWLFFLRENTALSRGWCMPLTRGSAVCEQNASHNTQILACFSDQLD